MKHQMPRFIRIIAATYLAFPVVYIWVAAVLFDVPLSKCVSILLSPSYYLVSLLAVLGGYGIWEMKRWGLSCFIAANIFILYENGFIIARFSESHQKPLAFLFSAFLLGFICRRVWKEVRVPYFLPKIKWWKSSHDYQVKVPVGIFISGRNPIIGEVLDLTDKGCFVKLQTDLPLDVDTKLKFNVFEQTIQCEGSIVWKTHSSVTCPKGIGIKFHSLSRNLKRKIRIASQRLKQISSLKKESIQLENPDQFFKILENLQSSSIDTLKENDHGLR